LRLSTAELRARHARLLRAEQVRLLYGSSGIALVTTPVAAITLTIVSWGQLPPGLAVAWLGYVLSVVAARTLIVRGFRRLPSDAVDVGAWYRRFVAGAAAAGLGWGAAGILFFSEASVPRQMFLALVLAGVAMASVPVLAPVMAAFLVFTIPTLLPITARVLKTWNPAAARTFGWTEREVLGRPYPIVPDDRRSEYRSLFDRSARGEPLAGFETQRQRKDGTLVDVVLSVAPLVGADGRVTGTMGILADITQRSASRDYSASPRRWKPLGGWPVASRTTSITS
jgi:PAS domain S-box-containing protein